MEYLFNKENLQTVNCYFFCKIEKKKVKLICFNDEQHIFDNEEDLKDLLFENNQIYFFEKLVKKGNTLYFIKNLSSFTKNTGEIINNDIKKYDVGIPYSLTGKIVKKTQFQILLLLSSIKEIVIINNIGDRFINIEENQYVSLLYIKYILKSTDAIYFILTEFSLLNLMDKKYQEKKINEKVAIQLNLLDYQNYLKDEEILLREFEIESPQNYEVKHDSYRKTIYYVYDASNYKNEYYAQNINLLFNNELYPIQFKFFVYKSVLNEANLFIKQKCLFAFEFIYFSLDNSLPKKIKILSKPNQEYTTNDFHTFGSKIRQSITFINIPSQNKEDLKKDNSFLKVFLCQKGNEELYGTFSLKSIEYEKQSSYEYDPIIEKNLFNIYNDYLECINGIKEINIFKEKYLSFGEFTTQILESRIHDNLNLYQFEENERTLNYFNSLCLWYLLFIITKKSQKSYSYVKEYVNLYKKIIDKKGLNNIEKIKILITFVDITLEDKNNFNCPKLVFCDELDENNPYKVANDFQFEIIENITEESCLFQPLLFFNSYIMDNIYSREFKFVKLVKPAYSISMLSLDLIKEHLRKSIKNYFFVLEKYNKADKRNYNASIHKFSKIVIYNENILLANKDYDKMYQIDKLTMKIESKFIKTFTFTLNLENLHEHFSHGKENIINIKESPTLYFDRNFKLSYIFNEQLPDYGEAGRLMEAFISEQYIIEEMKKSIYDMGDYLDVKFFTDKNFNKLNEGFKNAKESYNNKIKNNDNLNDIHNNEIGTNNYDVKYKLNEEENYLKNVDYISNNKDNQFDANKNVDIENENEIILSRYNTYTVTADTYEELFEKIEKLKEKKIIKRKDAINHINKRCWY